MSAFAHPEFILAGMAMSAPALWAWARLSFRTGGLVQCARLADRPDIAKSLEDNFLKALLLFSVPMLGMGAILIAGLDAPGIPDESRRWLWLPAMALAMIAADLAKGSLREAESIAMQAVRRRK